MKLSLLTKYLTYQLYHALHLIFKITSDGEITDIHQFRVAIRRIRSLSKLYLDTTILPDVLKKAIKETNLLRELDVLLSTIDSSAYPKSVKHLTLLRDNTFQSIFTDTFKQEVIHGIHQFYDTLCSLNPDPELLLPLAEGYYEECLDEYHTLVNHSTQKEFHHVRIKFKIARYSLDFLHESSIADEEKKIDECKRYQDILGAIQDTYNQLFLLKKLYEEYPIKEFKELIKKRKKILKKLQKLEAPVNRSNRV
jgi:CHAD domain-containing protein